MSSNWTIWLTASDQELQCVSMDRFISKHLQPGCRLETESMAASLLPWGKWKNKFVKHYIIIITKYVLTRRNTFDTTQRIKLSLWELQQTYMAWGKVYYRITCTPPWFPDRKRPCPNRSQRTDPSELAVLISSLKYHLCLCHLSPWTRSLILLTATSSSWPLYCDCSRSFCTSGLNQCSVSGQFVPNALVP